MNEYRSYNYLEHHGILGMKWGIRRYQNLDGTLTPAGKDRYKRYEAKNSGVGREESDILPTGMKVQNVAPSNKMRSGRMYVSYIEDDMSIYRSLMPQEQAGKKHYYVMYETITPLKVARGKDLVEAYLQLESNEKMKRKKFLIGKDEAAADEFLMEKLNSNKKLSESYFNILENKGFHAMQDVEDVRYDVSVDPLIIFNAEKVLKRLSVTELPKDTEKPPFDKNQQLNMYKSFIKAYETLLKNETDPAKIQHLENSVANIKSKYNSLEKADDLNKWLEDHKTK